MANEIERRFLVESQDWRPLVSKSLRISQGYLSTNPVVRVRVSDSADPDKSCAFITVKGLKVGFTAPEWEYPIPLKDGVDMLSLCSSVIVKERHIVTHDDKTFFEVDEFLNIELKGLVIAEIEIPSKEYPVEVPTWVSREISLEKGWSNAELSSKLVPIRG